MAPAAFVAVWSALLDRDPGSAHRGLDTRTELEEQATGILQTRAFLHSWRTASSPFRDGDLAPTVCAW